MKESPDHHDAELILRLYELRREEKLRKARDWFAREFSAQNMEEFAQQCPPGSEMNAYYRMVVTYWEMAGSIVNHGLIKLDLFFETAGGELFAVYEKLKPILPEIRKNFKNPHIYENLESLGRDYEKWMTKRAPGAVEAFRERQKAMMKKS
jgi:hypothetical protein